MSRNGFWYRYWHAPVSYWLIFHLSQVTILDIFAKVNSAQFPYLITNGELPQGTDFVSHPDTRVKALSVERVSIKFTSFGKREFVPRDQVEVDTQVTFITQGPVVYYVEN